MTVITSEAVFLAEYDVLYPVGYFAANGLAADRLTYGTHRWFISPAGYLRACACPALSMLAAPRELLCEAVLARKLASERGEKITRAEVGLEKDAPVKFVERRNDPPVLDVRHGRNFTGGRGKPDQKRLQELPYWGPANDWLRKMNLLPAEVMLKEAAVCP